MGIGVAVPERVCRNPFVDTAPLLPESVKIRHSPTLTDGQEKMGNLKGPKAANSNSCWPDAN